MQRHGWTLLFHNCLIGQIVKLQNAAERAVINDPQNGASNSNAKLLKAISHAIFDIVPTDPSRDDYRQGNTLGSDHRQWRRIKIGQKFRLFFRYDSKSKIIIFAWINDETTLRSSGSKSDPYSVFARMLKLNNPPNEWNELLAASKSGLTTNIKIGVDY
jgi:toxin YhaV